MLSSCARALRYLRYYGRLLVVSKTIARERNVIRDSSERIDNQRIDDKTGARSVVEAIRILVACAIIAHGTDSVAVIELIITACQRFLSCFPTSYSDTIIRNLSRAISLAVVRHLRHPRPNLRNSRPNLRINKAARRLLICFQ